MTEPIILELTSQTPWDGTTALDITRDALASRGGRFYAATINAGGVIPADMFGLMSPASPKVISVASTSDAPNTVARVVPLGTAVDIYREQLDLRPRFQTVFLSAFDTLRIRSAPELIAGTPYKITLVVNELNEAEAMALARHELRPRDRTRRFRLLRENSEAWTLDLESILELAWTYDADGSRYMTASTAAQGLITLRSLYDTRYEGVYAWFRFTGIAGGSGEVHQVDPRTKEERTVEAGITTLKWSSPVFLGYDDLLGFRTSAPPPDGKVAVEIELSHVRSREP